MESTKDSKSSKDRRLSKLVRQKLRPVIFGIRATAKETSDRDLRELCLKNVRVLIPLKRGRPKEPRTLYALQRRLAGDDWSEILPAKECIGPQPQDPNLQFTWNYAAQSIRKSVEREIRDLRRARKNHLVSPPNNHEDLTPAIPNQ